MIPCLSPVVKNYAWGRRGHDSIVARVGAAAGAISAVDPDEHYAELWLGDHPSGEAKVGGKLPLRGWLERQFGLPGLPYLLKLLANEQALSVQCHPDMDTAKRLHARDPHSYPSPTHKPEIALALAEDVEGFCGLLPWHRCAANFQAMPPALQMVGGQEFFDKLQSEQPAEKMKRLFAAVQRTGPEAVQRALNGLREMDPPPQTEDAKQAYQLALRLMEQFPGDVGCFAPLYMNYVVSKPGECLFLAANVLHAYLEGQIVECMASSDNVIRGGLTAKPRDVELLIDTVDFTPENNDVRTLRCPVTKLSLEWSGPIEPLVRLYTPPVDDFAVYFIVLAPGCSLELPVTGTYPGVLQVLTGSANVQLKLKDGGNQDFAGAKQGTSLLFEAESLIRFTHCEGAKTDADGVSQFPPLEVLLKGDVSASFTAVLAVAGK